MTSKWRNKLWLGGLLVALGLYVIPAWAHLPIPPKKGEFGRQEARHPAPSFTLTDQNGKLFHFKAASGRLVLVNFIYTSCPDVCPLFTANLASIQRTLEGDKQSNYTILSISADPARDTPAKLKEYADAFSADFHSWHFLTGSPKDLARIWNAFGVSVQDLGNGQVQHTNVTTIIDRHGFRRVNYFGNRWREKEVLKDLRRLAGEK